MEQRNKHIYPRIGTVLTVLSFLLVSCTERSLEMRPEPVPIRLYTGIRTRAAVDAFNGTPVCIACGTSAGSYTECWEGTATDGEIALTPVRYYPQDGGRLYLRSFYPPAPLGEDGTLTYTLTGEEDLMVTSEQNGSLDEPFATDDSKMLIHRHLLTKLGFRLKLEVANPGQYSIRTLHLNGLTQQVKLSLLTEELECGDVTASVTVYDAFFWMIAVEYLLRTVLPSFPAMCWCSPVLNSPSIYALPWMKNPETTLCTRIFLSSLKEVWARVA
ncbi:MAG: fimbrillin family protein [Bacteroides sp.]|nr:fimbrillin family protein [Bacteroides sp.]